MATFREKEHILKNISKIPDDVLVEATCLIDDCLPENTNLNEFSTSLLVMGICYKFSRTDMLILLENEMNKRNGEKE